MFSGLSFGGEGGVDLQDGCLMEMPGDETES